MIGCFHQIAAVCDTYNISAHLSLIVKGCQMPAHVAMLLAGWHDDQRVGVGQAPRDETAG